MIAEKKKSRNIKTVIGVLLLACSCSLFSSNTTVNSPSLSPVRAELRATVSLVKDAWMLAAQVCVNAKATPAGMPSQCQALIPAQASILAAATVVDALDNSATIVPAEVVCALVKATAQIEQVPGLSSPVVTDAASIVSTLGSCADDAGAE